MKRAALLALAGCSFTLSRPPDPPYHAMPTCSTSSVAPLADILGVVVAATGTIAFGIDSRFSSDGERTVSTVLAPVSAVGMVLYLISTVHGFRAIGACNDARSAYTKTIPLPPPLPAAEQGTERGACRATAPVCDPGLICASQHCVVWPPKP